MTDLDLYWLSVEQEEYLVELLCTRGACALDLFALELDQLCRSTAGRVPSRHETASSDPTSAA